MLLLLLLLLLVSSVRRSLPPKVVTCRYTFFVGWSRKRSTLAGFLGLTKENCSISLSYMTWEILAINPNDNKSKLIPDSVMLNTITGFFKVSELSCVIDYAWSATRGQSTIYTNDTMLQLIWVSCYIDASHWIKSDVLHTLIIDLEIVRVFGESKIIIVFLVLE